MCKRRPNNIRDKVVKADIGSFTRLTRQTFLGTERNGSFPCLGCACCSNVIKSSSIIHPHCGRQFRIRGFFTCDSNNVVYVVKCPCGLLYVGKTTQHIRDRIASHKSTIRCKKNMAPSPLPLYFCQSFSIAIEVSSIGAGYLTFTIGYIRLGTISCVSTRLLLNTTDGPNPIYKISRRGQAEIQHFQRNIDNWQGLKDPAHLNIPVRIVIIRYTWPGLRVRDNCIPTNNHWREPKSRIHNSTPP
ncbi:unnamed protein product [Ranitomeya imitator]|uniref:GIY-YIG domain-containing protein n=1 Tax=Ranitomeya imitator TaxID=111125 RepID=A0ABN9MD55_9NEOB|nr:unnamed protein product [Ranitomeya imitator]